jgi:hypothetical protein
MIIKRIATGINTFRKRINSKMEVALRQVIASYGYQATHECLIKIMKDDYSFLHKYHNKNVKEEAIKEEEQPEVKTKKPVKKKNKEEIIPVANTVTEIHPETILQDDMIDNMEVIPANTKGIKVVVNKMGSDNKPTFSTKKEADDWQKEKENATKARLEAEGIDPEDLLTEENLRLWVEKEDHGYAVVAREKVGLPESIVSEVCKKYGIESAQAKRRRMIMAQKFNGKRGGKK